MTDYSDHLIQAVKLMEGLKLTAYKCPSGVWTIGYGHTQGVRAGMTITRERAIKYLIQDLDHAATQVLAIFDGVALTQGQFDALVDFAYCHGSATLRVSAITRSIKHGEDTPAVQEQFRNAAITYGFSPARCEWQAKRYAE